jgi:hypothetical protein
VLEVQAGLAAARAAERSYDPEAVDELLLIGGFIRHPPPELTVLPLSACAARLAA